MPNGPVIHFKAEVRQWIKRLAAANHMTSAGFVEECVRRQTGVRKKLLPEIVREKTPVDVASLPPFWSTATRR